MKARFAGVLGAAIAFGLFVGWASGAHHGDCEHSCPARGPCPIPPDCAVGFQWHDAWLSGGIAAAITIAVGVIAVIALHRQR